MWKGAGELRSSSRGLLPVMVVVCVLVVLAASGSCRASGKGIAGDDNGRDDTDQEEEDQEHGEDG